MQSPLQTLFAQGTHRYDERPEPESTAGSLERSDEGGSDEARDRAPEHGVTERARLATTILRDLGDGFVTQHVLRYYGRLWTEPGKLIHHGPAEKIAEEVAAYADEIDVLILFPDIPRIEQVEQLAERVLPAYRPAAVA
jgi:hypothetical protein